MIRTASRMGPNRASRARSLGRWRIRLPSPHMILPWSVAVGATAFLVVPPVFTLISAVDISRFVTFPPHGFTLKWFAEIGSSYWDALRFSAIVGAVSTAVSLILGASAALGLVRGRFRGRGGIAAFMRAPLQVPYVVIGVAFFQVYLLVADDGGPDLKGSTLGLVLAHIVITVPFVVSAVDAGLAAFDTTLEAAAYGLGMGKVRTFFSVTMPTIRPSLFAGAFFSFLISFGNVPVSLFLSGTHVPLPVLMFQTADTAPSPTLYAVATVVTALSAVAVVAFNRFVGLRAVSGVQQ